MRFVSGTTFAAGALAQRVGQPARVAAPALGQPARAVW
jgi:hypothetical protein